MAADISRTERVSVSWPHVAKLWRDNDLKPHRQGRLKIFRDPWFADKVFDVVGLHLDSPAGGRAVAGNFGVTEQRTHDYFAPVHDRGSDADDAPMTCQRPLVPRGVAVVKSLWLGPARRRVDLRGAEELAGDGSLGGSAWFRGWSCLLLCGGAVYSGLSGGVAASDP